MPHVLCGVGVSVLAAARPRLPITAPLAAAAGRARAAATFRPGLRGRRATAAGPGGRNFRFWLGLYASPCGRGHASPHTRARARGNRAG